MKVKRRPNYFVRFSPVASIIVLLLLNFPPATGEGAGPVAVLADGVEKLCDKTYERLNYAKVTEAHKDCLIDAQEKLLSGTDKAIEKLFQATENGATIVIDGHRDKSEAVGISLTRANLLRDFLVNELGIDAMIVMTRNFGDRCPAHKTDITQNRRFRIWLVPKITDTTVADPIGSKLKPVITCPEGVTPITNETPAVPADPPE